MHHAARVQVLYGEDDLRSVELHHLLGEHRLLPQVEQQTSARDEVHYEVQLAPCLERKVQGDDERVPDLAQYVPACPLSQSVSH